MLHAVDNNVVDNDAVHGGGYATGAVKGMENNINNNNLHSGLESPTNTNITVREAVR